MDEREVSITKISADEYKSMKNFTIDYGFAETKFGKVLLGKNEDNICYAAFVGDAANQSSLLSDLKKEFPNAVLREAETIESEIQNVFSDGTGKKINVLLKGTDFETSVWEKLVSLKKGSTYSYEDVAKAIENPKAIRAVAKAVTKNKLAFIIPCHRVISKSGGLSKYKWGADRKMKLLKHEKAI